MSKTALSDEARFARTSARLACRVMLAATLLCTGCRQLPLGGDKPVGGPRLPNDFGGGVADWRFDAENCRVVITTSGGQSFEPLKNFGPMVFIPDPSRLIDYEKLTSELGPAQDSPGSPPDTDAVRTVRSGKVLDPGQLKIALVSSDRSHGKTVANYLATAQRTGVKFSVSVWEEGGALKVRIQAPAYAARGTSAGRLVGARAVPVPLLNRYAEPYGSDPGLVSYLPDLRLFVHAQWRLFDGNCASWQKAKRPRPGASVLPEPALAAATVYEARTDGKMFPVDETLELRMAPRLWDAVPAPENPPSEYREELAESVFVDTWSGGTAASIEWHLSTLGRLVGERTRFFTVIQGWQAGGFDSANPDAIVMPDYPPNPSLGTRADYRKLTATGRELGRIGYRTNYVHNKPGAPSVKAGKAPRALWPDSRGAKWHTKLSVLPALLSRQERQIAGYMGEPNCTFSDQLCSGGIPWDYEDWDAEAAPQASNLRLAGTLMRNVCEQLKAAHNGPLTSETLISEYLLGRWIATGDYGIMNGHHRLVAPEYRLRRLHHLSAFHGMGLYYRFDEMPPFKRYHSGRCRWSEDEELRDDYRLMTILWGNCGYVFWNGQSMDWPAVLTEALLVGHLQRLYALTPVREISYRVDHSRWLTLEQLCTTVRGDSVPDFERYYGFIRVEYENGLSIVANRTREMSELRVPGLGPVMIVPYGWVAFRDDATLVALSTYWPGTQQRVDYLRDTKAGLEITNPRGHDISGTSTFTVKQGGKVVLQLAADGKSANLGDGEEVSLVPPSPPPVTRLNFNFGSDFQGWRLLRDLPLVRWSEGALVMESCAEDPFMASPALALDGNGVAAVLVRMRVSAGEGAQLFWSTEDDPGIFEQRSMHVPVKPGQWQVHRFEVGNRPDWKGHTITRLRLDPIYGAASAEIKIEWIRAEER